jgi:hypothetical protein
MPNLSEPGMDDLAFSEVSARGAFLLWTIYLSSTLTHIDKRCKKKFKGIDFIHKHIQSKHNDRVYADMIKNMVRVLSKCPIETIT